MAIVVFYEKPGCGTNARQKRLLEAAGHEVVSRNLLAEPWTAGRLRSFFGDTSVTAWFNPAAPSVKSGAVERGGFDGPMIGALLGQDDDLSLRGCSRRGGRPSPGSLP